MLKYRLTHPELLYSLAQAGHGSRILLADSNYGFDIYAPPNARRIFLNIMPGMVCMKDLLPCILNAVPIEEALAVIADDGSEPEITHMYREVLPEAVKFERINRFDFYEIAKESRTTLLIATGETALYANLLLTVGYIKPDGSPNH